MSKKNKKLLELYFKNVQLKQDYESVKKELDNYNLEVKKFEEICKSELTPLEILVVDNFVNNRKSLKLISTELGYSYSYIRKVFVEAKDKMRIIATLTSNQ